MLVELPARRHCFPANSPPVAPRYAVGRLHVVAIVVRREFAQIVLQHYEYVAVLPEFAAMPDVAGGLQAMGGFADGAAK